MYQCLVNESATIQNLPINTLGYPDLQVNLQENELFRVGWTDNEEN